MVWQKTTDLLENKLSEWAMGNLPDGREFKVLSGSGMGNGDIFLMSSTGEKYKTTVKDMVADFLNTEKHNKLAEGWSYRRLAV